jgi:hypothetical protein
MGSLQRSGPGASCQGCHTTTQREIDPLDKGCVHSSRKAQSLQGLCEGGGCSQADHLSDSHQLAPLIAFLDLAIEQACRHLPLFPPAPSFLEPIPKMSGEGVEVRIEAIAGEDRQTERRPTVLARGG